MKKYLFTLALLCNSVFSSELLKLANGKIVNSNNKIINLKGCNVGNWLMLEMWMLNYADRGIADQYEFIKTLEDRFGKREAENLMDIYRANWIKEKDFDIIKSFGMNTVRLPFDYKLLMDSDSKPFTLKRDAWYWLDLAIATAKEKDLYVILDMHGAPGRQSGMDHSGRVGYNKLWSDKNFQDQTVWLWSKISKRYKNEPTVVAYDLLNEPWGSSTQNLKKITLRCYQAIRKNNDEHIVIFAGHHTGIDFYKNIKSISMENVIYTMHFYPGFFGWGSATPFVHAEFLLEGLQEWTDKMVDFNTPLLIGEFNVVLKEAGGGEMMRRYYDYYEKLNWPATMWSYKVLNEKGGINEGSWGMITNKNKLIDFDITSATKSEIIKWFKSFGSMEFSIDKDLQYWLTTNDKPNPLDSLPPKPPKVTEVTHNDAAPEPWNIIDIGRPLKGGQKITKKDWTIYGGGDDIWNEDDQFRFIYQKLKNNFELTIKVDSLTNTHTYAKAGIMVRRSLNTNSAHGLINFFPSGNSEYGYREKNGQTMQATSGPKVDWENARLKIKKNNSSVQFSIFSNNSWELIGELDISKWGNNIFVGLATLSHDNSQLTKAIYSDIELTNN